MERHHSTCERRVATADLASVRGRGETLEQIVEMVIADVKDRYKSGRDVTSDWAMVLVEEVERLMRVVRTEFAPVTAQQDFEDMWLVGLKAWLGWVGLIPQQLRDDDNKTLCLLKEMVHLFYWRGFDAGRNPATVEGSRELNIVELMRKLTSHADDVDMELQR